MVTSSAREQKSKIWPRAPMQISRLFPFDFGLFCLLWWLFVSLKCSNEQFGLKHSCDKLSNKPIMCSLYSRGYKQCKLAFICIWFSEWKRKEIKVGLEKVLFRKQTFLYIFLLLSNVFIEFSSRSSPRWNSLPLPPTGRSTSSSF